MDKRIQDIFLCINICQTVREVLKPARERRGFLTLPRGTGNVNESEKHVLSLLLHQIISLETIIPRTIQFYISENGTEAHVYTLSIPEAGETAEVPVKRYCNTG